MQGFCRGKSLKPSIFVVLLCQHSDVQLRPKKNKKISLQFSIANRQNNCCHFQIVFFLIVYSCVGVHTSLHPYIPNEVCHPSRMSLTVVGDKRVAVVTVASNQMSALGLIQSCCCLPCRVIKSETKVVLGVTTVTFDLMCTPIFNE